MGRTFRFRKTSLKISRRGQLFKLSRLLPRPNKQLEREKKRQAREEAKDRRDAEKEFAAFIKAERKKTKIIGLER